VRLGAVGRGAQAGEGALGRGGAARGGGVIALRERLAGGGRLAVRGGGGAGAVALARGGGGQLRASQVGIEPRGLREVVARGGEGARGVERAAGGEVIGGQDVALPAAVEEAGQPGPPLAFEIADGLAVGGGGRGEEVLVVRAHRGQIAVKGGQAVALQQEGDEAVAGGDQHLLRDRHPRAGRLRARVRGERVRGALAALGGQFVVLREAFEHGEGQVVVGDRAGDGARQLMAEILLRLGRRLRVELVGGGVDLAPAHLQVGAAHGAGVDRETRVREAELARGRRDADDQAGQGIGAEQRADTRVHVVDEAGVPGGQRLLARGVADGRVARGDHAGLLRLRPRGPRRRQRAEGQQPEGQQAQRGAAGSGE
jgi:hypothetical protein